MEAIPVRVPWLLAIVGLAAAGGADFATPLAWKKGTAGCTERFAFTAVYAPKRASVIVYAGEVNQDGKFGLLGDLWEQTGDKWAQVEWKGATPPPRAYHSAAFDTKQDAMWVFGGGSETFTAMDDLWKLDTTTWTWTKPEPQGDRPGARFNGALHYDPARHQLVLASGCKAFFQPDNAWTDAWTYDIAKNAWTKKKAEAPGRWQAASALAPELDLLVVHGGFDGGSMVRGDTWIYQLKDDKWIEAGKGYRATDAHAGVWDPVAKAMVVYGGASPAKRAFDELWAFDPKARKWTKLAAGKGDGPGPRAYHSAVFDPAEKRLWVFGGTENQFSDAPRSNEPWSVRLHK